MKKGFTLVELLAMIAILAVLALLTLPVINNSIDKQKEKVYEQNITTTKDALRNWANENVSALPEEGETLTITLGTLKDEGLVERNFKNPKTKKCYSNSNSLQIKNTSGVYTYELNELIDGNDIECQNVDYTYKALESDTDSAQTISYATRPANNVYLKNKVGSTSDNDTQVCLYDGYNELCFFNNEFENSKEKVLNYMNYDSSWTHPDSIPSSITTVWTNSSKTALCSIENSRVYCVSERFTISVLLSGKVKISNSSNYGCKVSVDEAPSCGLVFDYGHANSEDFDLSVIYSNIQSDSNPGNDCINCQGGTILPYKPGYDGEEGTI